MSDDKTFKPTFFRSSAQRANEMCRLKASFKTQKEAESAHVGHRAYRCPNCRAFHLTSVK